MTASLLRGTITAVVTPFSDDGATIDVESFRRLLALQLKAGVQGIVLCGSTGEAMTLNDDEYLAVVQEGVRIAKGKTLLIGGIGSNSTQRAAALAKQLARAGVDGLMVVAPPYNKPPAEGIIAHVQKIRDEAGLPILFYNVPGRTGINVAPKTVITMAERQLIIGVKEACGSVDQVLDILAQAPSGFSVLSGDDSLTVAMMSLGARGVVSVLSNVRPGMVVAMTDAAARGDFSRAGELQRKSLGLCRALFAESNPIPVKAALALEGTISSAMVRLPLCRAKEETQELLQQQLRALVE